MINFPKFNYYKGWKPIVILYKQVDDGRVLPLTYDIENIIGGECCTTVDIETAMRDNLLNIDACKVFILAYSSNFSDIDVTERNKSNRKVDIYEHSCILPCIHR